MLHIYLLMLIPIIIFAQIPEITNSTVVGGVTENSARIWVRLSQPGNINIELSESESFDEVIRGNETKSSESTNMAAIIEVSRLRPAEKYYYRILFNGTVIPDKIRFFNTFPEKGSAADFSFAFGSCQQSGNFLPPNTSSGNVFREIIKHDIDFFLQIGDWTYPDTTDRLPINNNYYSSDYGRVQENYISKYNKKYAMDTLLSTMSVDYIYDDHDYMNNNSSAETSSYVFINSNTVLTEEISAPSGTRENSIKGYKENFPSYELENESRGIYHKFTFGNAEFYMLDLRAQRSSNLNSVVKSSSTGKWVFAPPQGHTILGRETSPGTGQSQLAWFLNSLKNSTAKWKFVISSVSFNKSQRAIIDISIQLQDLIFTIPGYGIGVKGIAAAFEVADKWSGFPEDLDSVLSFIGSNNIKNVVVLSGDSHTSAMDDGTNAGLPELMSANLDITNSRTAAGLANLGINIWNKGGQGISTDLFNNAFGKVTVYGNDSVNLALIDEFGNKFASYTITDQMNTAVDNNIIPDDYYSVSSYPNPFNPVTKIEVTAGKDAYVSLIIYDLLGREVKTIASNKIKRGKHDYFFDASELTTGVYFCAMKVLDDKGSKIKYFETRKLLYLK